MEREATSLPPRKGKQEHAALTGLPNCLQGLPERTLTPDFPAPFALRFYLAPVFILAGCNVPAHAEHPGPCFESPGIPEPGLTA